VSVLGYGIGWLWAGLVLFAIGRVIILGRRYLDDAWLITGA